MNFVVGQTYTIATGADVPPRLAGKTVVFKGWVPMWGNVRPQVAIRNEDGSEGDVWLVNPSFIA